MQIEKQVCTLEQAKKLKELGIGQSTRDHWLKNTADAWVLHEVHQPAFPNEYSKDCYAAFTVAELLCLTGAKWLSRAEEEGSDIGLFYELDYRYTGHLMSKSIADGLAGFLIHLLETGKITASEVNERLAAAR